MPHSSSSYRVVLLTADRVPDARALEEEVRNQAVRSGGASASVDVTADPAQIPSVSGAGDPSTVLVILSGGAATRDDPAIGQAIRRARELFIGVLPVFDPAALFGTQIPTALQPVNGFAWPTGESPAAVAAVVLRFVGLAESDRRVFLSYRRSDGSSLANQLRYALADDGWDVFLDKFSVPPGVDFQERLDRELADKAFVLLAETPEAAGSPWVEHEVAFALRRRLGLLAVASPDTPATALYGAIDPAFRLQLASSAVSGPASDRVLTPLALQDLMRAVDERHAAAFAFRRQGLLSEAADEMAVLGYRVEQVSQWGLLAERGAQREVVLATARSPEAADVRETDRLRRQLRGGVAGVRGWIVHPTEDIDADRSSLLGWLCARRLVRPTPVMLLAGRLSP